ncbi:hypothetical protein OSTOST_11822 [Ostertagia ostertagi]
MFLLLSFLSLSTAVAIYVWRFYENTKRYPKGPRPYPIVGNLLSVDIRRLHEDYKEYTKVYGSVFTVWLPKPYVVITDYDLVKEAFAKKGDDFGGRSGIFPDTLLQNVENGGVIFSQVFIANIINKTLYGFSYEYDNCDRLMNVVEAFTNLFESSK